MKKAPRIFGIIILVAFCVLLVAIFVKSNKTNDTVLHLTANTTSCSESLKLLEDEVRKQEGRLSDLELLIEKYNASTNKSISNISDVTEEMLKNTEERDACQSSAYRYKSLCETLTCLTKDGVAKLECETKCQQDYVEAIDRCD